ncbi:MAG: hypothetical protein J0H68_08310 [Sphingobacteriia bacterium]|nr:hypothetical protein [Sphingobacteriia bacterium]
MKRILFLIIILFNIRLDAFAVKYSFFPLSTEIQIWKILPLIQNIPKGSYITVGSERGFRAASQSDNIDSLILVDIVPEILRFNYINIELLKARNKEQYKHLRWNSTFSEWKKVSKYLTYQDFEWWYNNVRDLEKSRYPLPELLNKYGEWKYLSKFKKIKDNLFEFYKSINSHKAITNKRLNQFIENSSYAQLLKIAKKYKLNLQISAEEWEWWEKFGKNREMYCSNLWLDNPNQVVELGKLINYKTGNYLFDDKNYNRLHKLALNNKIKTFSINLRNNKDLDNLISFIKKSNLIISVLDVNNLSHKDYVGEERLNYLVRRLSNYGKNNSVVITMMNYKNFGCAEFQSYVGFTFDNVKEWNDFKLQTFFESIPTDWAELINGKLYSKGEMPAEFINYPE